VGKVKGNWPEQLIPSVGKDKKKIYFNKIKNKVIKNGVYTFLNADNIRFLKKNEIMGQRKSNLYFIRSKWDYEKGKSTHINLSERISTSGGVFFQSILIMIYMGFKEIYLCGAGYTYDPIWEYHFYDNMVQPINIGKERAIRALKKGVEDRNNQHNTKLEYYGIFEKNDYFRGVIISRQKRKSNHYRKYRNLKVIAEKRGVKIINILPKGFESPIFEHTSWEAISGSFS